MKFLALLFVVGVAAVLFSPTSIAIAVVLVLAVLVAPCWAIEAAIKARRERKQMLRRMYRHG